MTDLTPEFTEALRAILNQKRESWPHLPVVMVVDDHIGGGNNRGWYEARYHVENCADYPEYIKELRESLHEKHGKRVTVYRVERSDVWNTHNWPTLADVGSGMCYREGEYLAATTSLDCALKFAELPMNSTEATVIIEMTVDVVDVIFEGHSGEGELVIRSPQSTKELNRKEAK